MVLPSTASYTESSSVATQSLIRAFRPGTPPTAPCAFTSLLHTCWTPTSACTLQTSTVCTQPITMWSWCWPPLARRETLSAALVSPCWTWPRTPFSHTLSPTGPGRSPSSAMPVTSYWRCSSQTQFPWTRAAWSRSAGTTSSWVWPQPTPRRTRAAKCATSVWDAEVGAVQRTSERPVLIWWHVDSSRVGGSCSVSLLLAPPTRPGLKYNTQYITGECVSQIIVVITPGDTVNVQKNITKSLLLGLGKKHVCKWLCPPSPQATYLFSHKHILNSVLILLMFNLVMVTEVNLSRVMQLRRGGSQTTR